MAICLTYYPWNPFLKDTATPGVSWHWSSRMNSLDWSKKQENFSCRSFRKFFVVFLLDCDSLFPFFKGYAWLFNHSFQEQVTRSSCWGSCDLLLQGRSPDWGDLAAHSKPRDAPAFPSPCTCLPLPSCHRLRSLDFVVILACRQLLLFLLVN